jgi:hypothetical protein
VQPSDFAHKKHFTAPDAEMPPSPNAARFASSLLPAARWAREQAECSMDANLQDTGINVKIETGCPEALEIEDLVE